MTDQFVSDIAREPREDVSGRARAMLAATDVWDMTLPWLRKYWNVEVLKRYRRAGFSFISLSNQDDPPSLEGVLGAIEAFKEEYRPCADWLTVADSLEDVERARRAGKLAVSFNVQNTVQIGSDLSRIETLRRAGVWHMLLAYQLRNLVAGGCAEADDHGLSPFGREVIGEMNRVGMVVDCSHTGYRSSLDAMEISTAPVIFSHSNAHAVCAHIRNLKDDQLVVCAATGGVVGVVGIGAFLGDPEAKVESVLRHIDHIAEVVGPEHIGIGTDYVADMETLWKNVGPAKDIYFPDPTGTQLYEGGCFQPEQLSDLVEALLTRGYPDAAVKGILGGNFKRVYSAVLGPA